MSQEGCLEEVQVPFFILSDYTWTSMDVRKQRTKENKHNTKKGKISNLIDGMENKAKKININLPGGCLVIEWVATFHFVDDETKNLL